MTVTLPLRAVALVLALVAILVAPSVAPASHAPPGTKLWAYQANVPPTARIYQYDIGTDTYEADCISTPSGNGRDRVRSAGFAPLVRLHRPA